MKLKELEDGVALLTCPSPEHNNELKHAIEILDGIYLTNFILNFMILIWLFFRSKNESIKYRIF